MIHWLHRLLRKKSRGEVPVVVVDRVSREHVGISQQHGLGLLTYEPKRHVAVSRVVNRMMIDEFTDNGNHGVVYDALASDRRAADRFKRNN